MMRLNKTTRLLAGLALSLLFLAACTTPTVVAPATPDLAVVRTEAVQTAVAKITIAAALNPTATEAAAQEPQVLVITATPEPTTAATAAPAVAQAATATATTAPTLAPATSGGSGGVYPTLTPRSIPDNLILISYSPEDGDKFNAGTKFDAVWKVKNTGTTTWGTDYYLRFTGGTDMGEAGRFYLKQAVQPGETVDLIADLIAPANWGTYIGNYQFCTPNADIIYKMYVMIVVP